MSSSTTSSSGLEPTVTVSSSRASSSATNRGPSISQIPSLTSSQLMSSPPASSSSTSQSSSPTSSSSTSQSSPQTSSNSTSQSSPLASPSPTSQSQPSSETSPSMSSPISSPNTPTVNPPTSTSTSTTSSSTTSSTSSTESTSSSSTESTSSSSTSSTSSTTSPPSSTPPSSSSEPVNPSTSSSSTNEATSNSVNPTPSLSHDTTVILTETSIVTPVVSVTVTSLEQTTSTPSAMITVIVTHSSDGWIVTQTSVVSSPSLSPNIGASAKGSNFLTNRGAIAAVAVVVALAVCSFILLGLFVYRRRRRQRKMEADVTTAAMAAVGIHGSGRTPRAPPFDDADSFIPPMAQRQRTFEDGTLFTSALDQDIERNGGDFNPYTRDAVVVLHRDAPPAENTARPPSPPPLSQAPSSSLGHGYGEHSASYANRSSSHGHDTSHSGHEPLIPSTSRSQSPPAYAALSGSFQRRRSLRRGSSVESQAPAVPPVPPHILTSFASPRHLSVNMDEDEASALSVYSQSDTGDEGGLSPLDPSLSTRLREGNDSGGTVGLRDHEDYSARPRLEIRNRTDSQRTYGTLE